MQLSKNEIIMNLIKANDHISCFQILEETGFNEKTVSSILAKFKRFGMTHVSKYVINRTGRVVKGYSVGPGPDVEFDITKVERVDMPLKSAEPEFVPRLDIAAQWIPARSEQELAAVNDSWIDYIVRYRR